MNAATYQQNGYTDQATITRLEAEVARLNAAITTLVIQKGDYWECIAEVYGLALHEEGVDSSAVVEIIERHYPDAYRLFGGDEP